MKKKTMLSFALLESSYWCFYVCFIGYASTYLLYKGQSNTVVSLLVSLFCLASFTGSIVWGSICDKLGTNRRAFLLQMTSAGILMYCLFFFGGNTAAAFICNTALGFFALPASANMDSWVLNACNKDQGIYGKIRSTPSFFCSFCAMFTGFLISGIGYRAMLIGGTVFLALNLFAAFRLPDTKSAESKSPKTNMLASAGKLLRNKQYAFLLCLLFFIGLAAAPLANLKIVVLRSVGGDVSSQGIDTFLGAIIQVPLIAMAGLTCRISIKKRYLLVSSLAAAMLLLACFAVNPYMIFAGTLLHNIGYSIILPTMREVTEKYIPTEQRNVGHNLCDAVYSSFTTMLALSCAGAIVDAWGLKTMLFMSTGLIAIPILLAIFYRPAAKG